MCMKFEGFTFVSLKLRINHFSYLKKKNQQGFIIMLFNIHLYTSHCGIIFTIECNSTKKFNFSFFVNFYKRMGDDVESMLSKVSVFSRLMTSLYSLPYPDNDTIFQSLKHFCYPCNLLTYSFIIKYMPQLSIILLISLFKIQALFREILRLRALRESLERSQRLN